jgi:hypothetical protein
VTLGATGDSTGHKYRHFSMSAGSVPKDSKISGKNYAYTELALSFSCYYSLSNAA